MNKLILLISLLLTQFLYAQDFIYQEKLKKGVTKVEDVKLLTDPVIELSEKPLRFFQSKEFPEHHMLVIQYIPSHLSDEDWENDKGKYQDYAVVFQFRYYNVGQNINLEKEGVKTFVFDHVRGRYLALFGLWQKYFDTDANREEYSTKLSVEKGKYTFKISQGSSGVCYIR